MTAKEIYDFIAKQGPISETRLGLHIVVTNPEIETQKELQSLIDNGYIVLENGLYAISGKVFRE